MNFLGGLREKPEQSDKAVESKGAAFTVTVCVATCLTEGRETLAGAHSAAGDNKGHSKHSEPHHLGQTGKRNTEFALRCQVFFASECARGFFFFFFSRLTCCMYYLKNALKGGNVFLFFFLIWNKVHRVIDLCHTVHFTRNYSLCIRTDAPTSSAEV